MDLLNWKPITTRVHGVLDYLTAGLLHALPYWGDWSPTARHVAEGSASASAAYSLMTDYELSAAKLVPMKAHLAMDAISGIALVAAAFALVDEEDRPARTALAAVGVFEIAAALLTQTKSPVPSRKREASASTTYPISGDTLQSYQAPAAYSSHESSHSRAGAISGL